MPEQPNHQVRVQFMCGRGHQPHVLCIPVNRGVPPELRCDQPRGYSPGGGGCPIPPDLEARVRRELEADLEKWKRLGHVVIHEN